MTDCKNGVDFEERITRGTVLRLIVSVAITGGIAGKEANPNLPETRGEQIESAFEAYTAGASMVYINESWRAFALFCLALSIMRNVFPRASLGRKLIQLPEVSALKVSASYIMRGLVLIPLAPRNRLFRIFLLRFLLARFACYSKHIQPKIGKKQNSHTLS